MFVFVLKMESCKRRLKDQIGCDNAKLTNTGLFIDTENPCLACSPDALVEIPGAQEPLRVVENKCPYSIAYANPPKTAFEAAGQKKFYCQRSSSGEVQLKENHDYYFQIQETLAIMNRQWCDFVVWTPSGILIRE